MSEITCVRGDATVPSVTHTYGAGFTKSRTQKTAEPLDGCAHLPGIRRAPAGGNWSRVDPLITERPVRRRISGTVHDHGASACSQGEGGS